MSTATEMSPDDFSELRNRAQREINRLDISRDEAAKLIGIGKTMFSQFMNDKYPNPKTPAAAVEKWLERQAETHRLHSTIPASPDFILTPTAEKIWATVKYAQMASDMVAIYGGPGVGKTQALESFKKQAGGNVWMTTATAAQKVKPIGPTLQLLADMLGLPNSVRGGNFALLKTLVDKVKDTKGLMIIDEAQKLGLDSIEAIRDIHDATGVGVALCGNELVSQKLTGPGMRADFAQLSSRISRFVRIESAQKADAWAIANHYRLKQSSPEAAFCQKIAAQHGGLRALVKTLQVASFYADGSAISKDHISQAWKDRGGRAL